MAELRDRTKCVTVMGREAPVDVVSMRVGDGDPVEVEGVSLHALHTPGHTAESYSFAMEDRVFTGDTLLIRGTGRTDFQNGDPLQQYDSLLNKLLTLPDETLVYPGHDYKGDTVSTVGEERRFNPRLQVSSPAEYAALMNGLNLANPKMMDVAVPANLSVGRGQADEAHPECAMTAEEVMHDERPGDILVDLREDGSASRRARSRIPSTPPTSADRHDRPGRGVARARFAPRATARLLLRIRRALGDGGRCLARARPRQCLPHDRRYRRVREAGGTIEEC